jgi:hypothetical protein
VHSSTSSFRPLAGGWFSLGLGVALAVALLGGYELFWRHRGFVPTLTNNESLWCSARAEVGSNSVAIIGSSRLQRGLDPQLLGDELGRPAIQLALDGASPFPMLTDLARDTSFAGVVVVEYMPKRWFAVAVDSSGVARTQPFLDSCRSPSLVNGIESKLDRQLEKRFVVLSPELQFVTMLSYAAHAHALPHDSRDILREDRLILGYPRKGDPDLQASSWEPFEPNRLAQRLDAIKRDIATIRNRGGCVIIYRSPVDGAALDEEEQHFPADPWFRRTVATLETPSIDFAAFPELRALKMFDGSHPSADQVPVITNVVGHEIDRLLRTGACAK